MKPTELYRQILGIQYPWHVTAVELHRDQGELLVFVELDPSAELACPTCGRGVVRYDHRERRWRHLDTCQYKTILVASVPRVNCEDCGIRQVEVPWAEAGSRFTALFEALVIDWLKEANIAAVARQMRLSWDSVDGIMSRAVRRGLQRRESETVTRIGVDETSFQKRHEYVTVVSDLERTRVLHVADRNRESSLGEFYETLTPEQRAQIEVVCMDMWRAYIASTRRYVPDAEEKIAFDKFHVAKLLGDAVDRVRRAERKKLRGEGNDVLKGTRYYWLQNPDNMNEQRWRQFADLRESALKTARAWAIKELAMALWTYTRRGWARRAWKQWLGWALRSRIEPIRAAAKSIRKYLWGILNAIVLGATNARAEGMNSKIQMIKRRACGYRNRERFKMAIYFHLGGLDLYPKGI
jgi:transposase